MLSPRTCAIVMVLILGGPAAALANPADYIDETFVYPTLNRGELELEGWAESRLSADHESRAWYTAAFEYGVTSRLTLDCAAQAVVQGAEHDFGRARFETRYRLAEQGAWPLDLAVSAEFEHETRASTGGDVEDTVTPRLVISRDLLSGLNTTLNLDLPIRLSGEGDVSFAYALGLAYPAAGLLRGGVELKQQPSEKTASAFPQIWLDLPEEFTIKLGGGIGLTSETDRFIGRLVLEKEF